MTQASRLRLTLRTLGRGDGLLGMMAFGPVTGATRLFGPRGDSVTVALLHFENAESNAQAEAILRSLGLQLLPPAVLQWRGDDLTLGGEGTPSLWPLWTLPQEAQFADFWAEQVPLLQAQGWQVVAAPGFAHASVPVQDCRLTLARREGSWLISLGVEVEGQMLDLAPLLADLLKRDGRWLDAPPVPSCISTARAPLAYSARTRATRSTWKSWSFTGHLQRREVRLRAGRRSRRWHRRRAPSLRSGPAKRSTLQTLQ